MESGSGGGSLTVLDPKNAGLGIDDRHRVLLGTHLARRGRVRNGIKLHAHLLQDLFVRLHARAGVVLISDRDLFQDVGAEDLPSSLERRNDHITILLRGKPGRVDDRGVAHAVGADGHGADRCRRLHDCEERRVHVPVLRRAGVGEFLVADELRESDVFHFGPVGWVFGQC